MDSIRSVSSVCITGSGLIKTDKHVWGKGINPKTKEIKDAFVIQQVSITVVDYMERLNKRNISGWTLE